jgi:hypothetical protein
MPVVTFGGGGGHWNKGYYIDYRYKPIQRFKNNVGYGRDRGRPYKQALISYMAAAGVSKEGYMKYGDGNGFGQFKTNVSDSDIDNPYAPFAAEHNDPLPFFYKS